MHEIRVVVGDDEFTSAIRRTWPGAMRVPLTSELFLVPLDEELSRAIVGRGFSFPDLEAPDSGASFGIAMQPLVDALVAVPSSGRAAIILTQYFAGVGEQAAICLDRSDATRRVLFGRGSIHEALVGLGVRAESPGVVDAFDEVGLGHWRSTDEIVDDALALAEVER